MSIEVLDESGRGVDVRRLSELGRFVMDRMRVHPLAELCIKAVDEETIAGLNEEHLGKQGPTDVLAFPIDEPGESPPGVPSILGDVVLCPTVAHGQAPQFGRTPHDEVRLLTVHGILHLLGMDHATPTEEAEMFGLTDDLLASYAARSAGQ